MAGGVCLRGDGAAQGCDEALVRQPNPQCAVPVIHVIHRQVRVDLPFVRLAKDDTIHLQANDETKRNRS